MIGKFLRFAFMDKATREKWEATQAAKRPRGKGPAAAASNKGRGKAAAEAQVAPRASVPRASAPAEGASDAPQGEAAIRAAIAEAVAAAEREMLEEVGLPPDSTSRAQQGKQTPPSASSMAAGDDGSDRAQLIRSALTVHKMKQSALADLGPEQRARLRALAEAMMGVADGKAGENSDGGGQDR